jgi:hypothetical protein
MDWSKGRRIGPIPAFIAPSIKDIVAWMNSVTMFRPNRRLGAAQRNPTPTFLAITIGWQFPSKIRRFVGWVQRSETQHRHFGNYDRLVSMILTGV